MYLMEVIGKVTAGHNNGRDLQACSGTRGSLESEDQPQVVGVT